MARTMENMMIMTRTRTRATTRRGWIKRVVAIIDMIVARVVVVLMITIAASTTVIVIVVAEKLIPSMVENDAVDTTRRRTHLVTVVTAAEIVEVQLQTTLGESPGVGIRRKKTKNISCKR